MAAKVPAKIRFLAGGTSGIDEMQVGDFVGIDHGGTGATTAAGARAALEVTLQRFYSAITAATGTTSIPDDNTTPLSSEGTQLWSQAITLVNATNKVNLAASIQVECRGTDFAATVLTAFRGTTCIGSRVVMSNHRDSAEQPLDASLLIDDAPGSVGPHTYSIRVGRLGAQGTWYAGRSTTARLNGTLASGSSVVLEEFRP